MSFKKLILSALLLSLLTAATAGYRWWKSRDKTPALQRVLPSAPEELQKLIQQYRRKADSSASVAGTIRIYDRENKDLLKESKTFRYLRYGMEYYMQLSSLQFFCDGIWLVQLDTVNRQIVVEKAPPGGPGGMMSLAPPPEIFFSDTARLRISGTVMAEGDQRSLRLQSELNPEIRSSTLFYDTLSYQLNKAEIERWKPGTSPDEKGDKIWLVKIDYQYPPAEKMDLRKKIKSIVSIDGHRVIPGAAYRDYEVNANNN